MEETRRGRGGARALWALVAVATACGGPVSGGAELETRAEATDYRETTRYDEVVGFMEAAARASPRIRLTTFGYTLEGRPLPLAVVGDVEGADAGVVRAAGGTRVYLQGNIHGGEVCGKEALLALLREVASGEHSTWLDSLVLLVAPVYNADGNERIRLDHRPRQHGPIGGMGQRPNAAGRDLNRDHTRLETPEARSFAHLLTRYEPHVTVDLHTTNGTRHGYHLTYSPPYHPNTPDAVVGLLRDAWLPAVTGAMESAGWRTYYYGNVYPPREGAAPGWVTFDHRPRFNNNYVGLRNRFAILSEAYAYATFRDRVAATRRFVVEVLDFAAERSSEIRRIAEEADAAPVMGDSLAVRAELEPSDGPVEILMGEVIRERHPYTGAPILRRADEVRRVGMLEWGSFRGTEHERAPGAYLVPPSLGDVVERLEAHGVRTRAVREARTATVERFRVDSVRTADEPFQGVRHRTAWGAWEPAGEARLEEGTAVVSTDQALGRLVFTLLEPRSDDGFVEWGIVDPASGEGGAYPVLRVPEATGLGG